MPASCDRQWEIDAIREGRLGAKDEEAFRRHARACEACATAIARDARLRAIAASMPSPEPNELDLRRLRARVLRDVATGARPRRAPFASLAVASAVTLLAIVAWARFHAVPKIAHFGAPVASTVPVAGVERVGQASGTPTSEAPPKATAPPPPASVVRAPPAKTLRPTASSRVPADSPVDDGSDAYAASIALLQTGQPAAAASGFRAFLLAYPGSSLVEDASFLEAAALARAGRPDAAALAAEEHLARFPRSFHRREAAILVARAARDRGDCAQARAVLTPWLGSPPDDEVRSTLQRCAEQ
jgi:TolA-binding protein